MKMDPIVRYAAVYILDNPICIDDAYHYYIPPAMAEAVVRGSFVMVPFGKGNRKQLGIVVDIGDTVALPVELPLDKLKPLYSVCRRRLCLSEQQLALCTYIRETTLCTMGEAVHAILPASSLSKLTEYYTVAPKGSQPNGSSSGLDAADLLILEYIRTRGRVSGQALKSRFGAKASASLDYLWECQLVCRELALPQPSQPMTAYYRLSASPEELAAILGKHPNAPRIASRIQRRVLEVLAASEQPLTLRDLQDLAGAGLTQLRALVEKGLVSIDMREEALTPSPATPLKRGHRTPHELSEEQAAAIRALEALVATGEARAALLHGVTGSGKTCVILEMIDRMLDADRGCIVLLPEIALTPQMLDIFEERYGDHVAVIHSGLSVGERMQSHRRILAEEARVVVGTRSAVFAPVPRLGMIVMDEEQEHTYKSDMNPKYHARDIARFRCATEGALLLLSSATPSVESYQKALDGKYTLIRMKQRYGSAVLPEVRIVDMRREPAAGNTTPLSAELLGELSRVREEGNQSVIFLNRRGYNSQLVCRSCGQAVICPRCSVAMHIHVSPRKPEGELVCHWCGTRKAISLTCPACHSPHLARMGYGTQRVEEELRSAWPGARILRMDADTTTQKSAYSDLLTSFREHEADILLGTQMVTKGHDFPDVTLVGVLMADMSLYLDDYRAAERTFSMLTQVIGRAGRADKPGLAIIQTMNPEHDVLRRACAQDYEAFFREEIRLRKFLQFPPFCDIVLLTLQSPDEKELQKASLRLSEEIRRQIEGDFSDIPVVVFGPFEAPVYRVDNVYRMRMVVKCRLGRRSRQLFSLLQRSFSAAAHGASRGSQQPILSIDINPSSI